jgi:hypothetical protein
MTRSGTARQAGDLARLLGTILVLSGCTTRLVLGTSLSAETIPPGAGSNGGIGSGGGSTGGDTTGGTGGGSTGGLLDAGDDGGFDAGDAGPDAGFDAGTDGGALCAAPPSPCAAYTDCCSGDCFEGACIDRSQWSCTYVNYYDPICTIDGGADGGFVCRGNGFLGCTSWQDCCSSDCSAGTCNVSMPPSLLGLPTDAGSDPDSGCMLLGSGCAVYTDCCSSSCFNGTCVPPAPDGGACPPGDAGCLAFSDCCTLECFNGTCVDGTAPH